MSFQAYLDRVEELTGKTPNDFIAMARDKNLTQNKDILDWLKRDFGLGLGHARAMAYVIQHGPKFTVRQTTGPHRDATDTLILTGRKAPAKTAARKTPRPAARKTAAAKKPAAAKKRAAARKSAAKKSAGRRPAGRKSAA
jgi:hypothetical protein